MKVYNLVISSGSYEDERSWTEGIFSTLQKAEEAKKAIEDFISKHLEEREEAVEPGYEDNAWDDWFSKYRSEWWNDFNYCQINEVLIDSFNLPY